jgi:hypothetical protein
MSLSTADSVDNQRLKRACAVRSALPATLFARALSFPAISRAGPERHVNKTATRQRGNEVENARWAKANPPAPASRHY